MDADRRGQHGDVACERLQHGQAEALVRGGHEHGVGGVDVEGHLEGRNAPERQESRVLRRLLRAVEALDGPRRVGREEQAGLVGRHADALARLGARDRREAIQVHAAGQHRDASALPGAGDLARQLRADGRDEVDEGQRRAGDPPRARMAQVGAVERHDVRRAAQRERGPRREPEVRVDDVEALAAMPTAQLAGGAQRSRPAERRRPRRRRRRARAGRRPGRGRSCRSAGSEAEGHMFVTMRARIRG